MGLWQWIYLQWLFSPSLILDTVDIAHTIYPHKLAHFHQSQQWIKIQSWILNVTLMENLSQVKIHHIYSPAITLNASKWPRATPVLQIRKQLATLAARMTNSKMCAFIQS